MATQIQWRRGSTASHSTFTGAIGEITVDTTKKTVVVHDGSTAGGIPLARVTGETFGAFTLGGAITGNSQNISGLGTLGCGAITSSGTFTSSTITTLVRNVQNSYMVLCGGTTPGTDAKVAIGGSAYTGANYIYLDGAQLLVRDATGGTERLTLSATALTLGSGITSISGGTNPSLNIGTGALTAGAATLSGNLRVDAVMAIGGAASAANGMLDFRGTHPHTGTSVWGIALEYTAPATAVGNVFCQSNYPTLAASLATGNVYSLYLNDVSLGAGASVTNQYGISIADQTKGTSSNYGIYMNVSSGTGKYAIYSNGTAASFFGGNVAVTGTLSATSSIGYATGAGGTVTQATSRTTGVTINKPSGAITLVSAAGSTSWQTFTVTNSFVAATDVIIVNQKSGTDLNEIHVTAVGAGSFNISFKTTGGTTTEQPVFNFNVMKGIAA